MGRRAASLPASPHHIGTWGSTHPEDQPYSTAPYAPQQRQQQGWNRSPVQADEDDGEQDDDDLYLVPEASCSAVARFCREAGNPFSASESRLRRELEKEGFLESQSGRHTKPVRIGGKTRRLLVLKRAAVEARLGEEFPEPIPLLSTVTGFSA